MAYGPCFRRFLVRTTKAPPNVHHTLHLYLGYACYKLLASSFSLSAFSFLIWASVLKLGFTLASLRSLCLNALSKSVCVKPEKHHCSAFASASMLAVLEYLIKDFSVGKPSYSNSVAPVINMGSRRLIPCFSNSAFWNSFTYITFLFIDESMYLQASRRFIQATWRTSGLSFSFSSTGKLQKLPFFRLFAKAKRLCAKASLILETGSWFSQGFSSAKST